MVQDDRNGQQPWTRNNVGALHDFFNRYKWRRRYPATYCTFSFLCTARPHTHTHARTHPRFKLFFYFFFNRDVFKYPGQTSLLACNKPCISVYTDDGEERRGRKGKKGNVTNRFLARIERILSIRVSVFPGATNAEEGRSRCKLRANVISKEKSFARDNSFIV